MSISHQTVIRDQAAAIQADQWSTRPQRRWVIAP